MFEVGKLYLNKSGYIYGYKKEVFYDPNTFNISDQYGLRINTKQVDSNMFLVVDKKSHLFPKFKKFLVLLIYCNDELMTLIMAYDDRLSPYEKFII